MRVLLVEDAIKLTEALSYLFRKNNIEIDVANEGEYGLILAQQQIYDVIVLDIMLPGINGLEILKTIRSKGINTPVLLLTAKDTVEDKVLGLESGADDYLVKPFASAELLARVRSLARRINTNYISLDELSVGNLKLNMNSYTVSVGDISINLSSKEALLLELLMKRPNQVFTKEHIITSVWGYNSNILENNVEIYVHHLRKKLESKWGFEIVTIRGLGYTLKERSYV